MSEGKFYIRRYRLNDGKVEDLDGKDLSLEDDFGHVFYKSLTGVNSRGEQKGLYVETYPECDSARIWLSSVPHESQTSSVLALYVFGASYLNDGFIHMAKSIKRSGCIQVPASSPLEALDFTYTIFGVCKFSLLIMVSINSTVFDEAK